MEINKDKLITFLAGAVILLACFLGLFWSANKDLKNSITNFKDIAEAQADSTHHYKNKYGEEVAKRKMAEASLEAVKATYSNDIREIKKQLGVNTRDIKGIFKAITITKGGGEGSVDTVFVDSGPHQLKVTHESDWFKLWGTVTENPGGRPDPLFFFNYEVRDSITLVPYKQRDGLYVKGVATNPHTRITGLEGVLVAKKEKNKRWGIGPSIQIGYDTQIRITPGLSVQYSLIRL